MSDQIERYCEVMHDAYEKAAVGAGWETQQASRKPWADVPEANKVTMRVAVSALVEEIVPDRGEIERLLINHAVGRTIPKDAGEYRALITDALLALLAGN
jgi:hypothetical protein